MPILKILEEDSALPIDLEEVKLFLKIDYDDENEIVKRAFKTAIKQCEYLINKTLVSKKYSYSIYKLDKRYIDLPYGPIDKIIDLKLLTKNNTEKEINNYFVDNSSDRIVFENTFDNFYRIDIIYTSLALVMGEDLKQAILLHTAKIYEDKLTYSPVPPFSINVYKNYKLKRL